jgi:hypothetical protein
VSDPTNTGHGHVRERPDGYKARCGGPALCGICARERATADGLRPILPPGRNCEIDDWLAKCTRRLVAELARKGWPVDRYDVKITVVDKKPPLSTAVK